MPPETIGFSEAIERMMVAGNQVGGKPKAYFCRETFDIITWCPNRRTALRFSPDAKSGVQWFYVSYTERMITSRWEEIEIPLHLSVENN